MGMNLHIVRSVYLTQNDKPQCCMLSWCSWKPVSEECSRHWRLCLPCMSVTWVSNHVAFLPHFFTFPVVYSGLSLWPSSGCFLCFLLGNGGSFSWLPLLKSESWSFLFHLPNLPRLMLLGSEEGMFVYKFLHKEDSTQLAFPAPILPPLHPVQPRNNPNEHIQVCHMKYNCISF